MKTVTLHRRDWSIAPPSPSVAGALFEALHSAFVGRSDSTVNVDKLAVTVLVVTELSPALRRKVGALDKHAQVHVAARFALDWALRENAGKINGRELFDQVSDLLNYLGEHQPITVWEVEEAVKKSDAPSQP